MKITSSIPSAFLMSAGRVIAIDNIPERLELAEKAGAKTINFQDFVCCQLQEDNRF